MDKVYLNGKEVGAVVGPVDKVYLNDKEVGSVDKVYLYCTEVVLVDRVYHNRAAGPVGKVDPIDRGVSPVDKS